jgi:hypothetical protein
LPPSPKRVPVIWRARRRFAAAGLLGRAFRRGGRRPAIRAVGIIAAPCSSITVSAGAQPPRSGGEHPYD